MKALQGPNFSFPLKACIGITSSEMNPSFSQRYVLSAVAVLSVVTSKSINHTNNLLGKLSKVPSCNE